MDRGQHYREAERLMAMAVDEHGQLKTTVMAEAAVKLAKVHAILATTPLNISIPG